MKKIAFAYMILRLSCLCVISQPLLNVPVDIQGIRLFPDIQRADHYYYGPEEIQLKFSQEGRPNFQLLAMRYTGTRVYGDQGSFEAGGSMGLGIEIPTLSYEKRAKIHTILGAQTSLEALSLQDVQIALVCEFLDVDGEPESVNLENGFIESGSVWTQKQISLNLDKYTTQILWKAFEESSPIFSINYAYYGSGYIQVLEDMKYTSTDSTNGFENSLESDGFEVNDSLRAVRHHLIYSNALNIAPDIKTFPDLLRKVDINSQIPPAYPLKDIYCFYFRDHDQTDLFAKIVEMMAVSVDGRLVTSEKRFLENEPYVNRQQIRFDEAVDMSKSLAYRVVNISKDGSINRSKWFYEDSWNEVIDISGLDP